MKKVEIRIDLKQPLKKIVYQSLAPELGRTVARVLVNISETGNGIVLIINAEDTSALRAALNSYLRWLNCIISTAQTFKPENDNNIYS